MVSAAPSLPSNPPSKSPQASEHNVSDRGASGHVYPNVTISGNAQVHLGDQYHAPTSQSLEDATHSTDKFGGLLRVAANVARFATFASRLLQSFDSDERGRCATLGATSIALVNERLHAHITTLLGHTTLVAEENAQPSLHILLDALASAVQVARSLETSLERFIVPRKHSTGHGAFNHSDTPFRAEECLLLSETIDKVYLMLFVSLANDIKPNVSARAILEEAKMDKVETLLIDFVKQFLREQNTAASSLRKSLASRWFSRIVRPNSAATSKAVQEWLSQHHTTVIHFTTQLRDSIVLLQESQARKQIVDSLAFPEMNYRYTAISAAQSRTFGWLLEMPGYTQSSGHYFASWLAASDRDNHGLFWISGKPGSGKSTLMRYLHDHPSTRAIATTWCQSNQLIIATCFFWSSGTFLQKSQQGLLQTLLYQLLVECNDFPQELFPERFRLQILVPHTQGTWSLGDLQAAMLNFVDHYSKTTSILFLVDGLDEYQGSDFERQDICQLLRELAGLRCVKICASSRHWNVYKDAFRTQPQLRLEDLTRGDIKNYVEDTFKSNEHYQTWSQVRTQEPVRLVTDITNRAQGVFLWVRLVVRSLLTGLQNGDDANDMIRRLHEIPPDLTDYFWSIIQGLDPAYLEQASQIFELALLESHFLVVFFYTHETQHASYSDCSTAERAQERVSRMGELEERRINSRCLGLLEVIRSSTGEVWECHDRVDFLHRTARDFIASPEVQAHLLTLRTAPFNAKWTLFHALIRLLRNCDVEKPCLASFEQFRLIFRMLKLTTELPEHQAEIVQSVWSAEIPLNNLLHTGWASVSRKAIQRELETYEPAWPRFNVSQKEVPTVLSLAIDARLDSLALHRLHASDAPTIVQKPGRPLLDRALISSVETDVGYGILPCTAIIERLLKLGASADQWWEGRPVWVSYLATLLELRGSGNDKTANPIDNREALAKHAEIVRLLICSGIGDEVRTSAYGPFSLKTSLANAFEPHTVKELMKLRRQHQRRKYFPHLTYLLG